MGITLAAMSWQQHPTAMSQSIFGIHILQMEFVCDHEICVAVKCNSILDLGLTDRGCEDTAGCETEVERHTTEL